MLDLSTVVVRGAFEWPHLQVPALRLQPVIDETLRISGKAQHELSLGLQVIDGFNGLMDLKVTPTERNQYSHHTLYSTIKISKQITVTKVNVTKAGWSCETSDKTGSKGSVAVSHPSENKPVLLIKNTFHGKMSMNKTCQLFLDEA